MNFIELFAGIGGFSLGLERAGMECVGHCEIDSYAQKVLKKHWPEVPLWDDIRRLDGKTIGTVELVCGGFPCQPFSIAGKKAGKSDNRDLWPEMFRVIKECRPSWVIGENVANFLNMAFERTKADLESEGYEVWPVIIPACGLGAPHQRARVFILAYSNSPGLKEHSRPIGMEKKQSSTERASSDLPNSKGRPQRGSGDVRGKRQQGNAEGLSGQGSDNRIRDEIHAIRKWWEAEPELGRVVDGVPKRVDRLRCLGNAVVPQIAELIGRSIMKIESS